MDQRQRARLAFNGLVIFVLGLVIAIPFAIIFSSGHDKNTHLWQVAHLELEIPPTLTALADEVIE